MTLEVSLDIDEAAWPSPPDWTSLVEAAAKAALATALGDGVAACGAFTVDVVLADDPTVAALNKHYRSKPNPTNVLSFPAPPVPGLPLDEARPLGDIILASGVVCQEAIAHHKPLDNHVSHLVIHGMLHLMGYGHDSEEAAEELAKLEIAALKRLDMGDPYADHGG